MHAVRPRSSREPPGPDVSMSGPRAPGGPASELRRSRKRDEIADATTEALIDREQRHVEHLSQRDVFGVVRLGPAEGPCQIPGPLVEGRRSTERNWKSVCCDHRLPCDVRWKLPTVGHLGEGRRDLGREKRRSEEIVGRESCRPTRRQRHLDDDARVDDQAHVPSVPGPGASEGGDDVGHRSAPERFVPIWR